MAPKFHLQAQSKLTERYQTTVPEKVREVLGLRKHDRIKYTIESNNRVIMSRDELEEDPVLGNFLEFLAQDMSKNPQRIQAINSDLFNRTQSLVAGVEFDIDTSLLPESEEDE